MSWLLDTLLWTGALIALVLLVRRPASRHFGPRVAYALWTLPLARLFLPPLVLPASWAPAAAPVSATPAVSESVTVAAMAPAEVAPAAATTIDWLALVAAVWLVGALAYIVLRLQAYARLRRELLAGSREVGAAGKVRLVETPATRSPLAFGVSDKVIALPPGFMAQADRAARDLALAHELAHHRAHDLAANFAALPLFALHWFNPLSWLGWTAMRRDQEAACDARVVEGRARSERAFYAAIIADAVAAPKFALAAPMACPVLGDKSIIHRLRNLTMSDHSRRRRRAGNWLVGLAALALPLTASFSYAQADGDVAELPEPPVPPEAPVAPLAPVPPEAPEAPVAPVAPRVFVDRIITHAPLKDGKQRRFVIVDRGHGTHVLAGPDGKPGKRKYVISNGKALDPDSPEFEAEMEALDERLSKLDDEIERRVEIDEERIERMAEAAAEAAERGMRVGTRYSVAPRAHVDRAMRMPSHALAGLRSARSAIAHNDALSAETRKEVLGELDREIARLEAGKE